MAQLTQRAILNAFLNLLEQRPFEKITVRDIVVECGITRNTFYYHFEDVYAVLKALLAADAKRAAAQIGDSDKLADCFMEAMSFVLEHKKAAYHICRSSRKDELLRCLEAEASAVLIRYIDRLSEGTGAKEEDKTRLVSFYRCALIGMLAEWVESGMKTELVQEICTLGVLMEDSAKNALRISAGSS